MTDPGNRLGGRLPLLDRADLAPAQRTLWDRMDTAMGSWAAKVGFASKTPDGRFIGPFNPMLRSPAVATTFLQLQADEERNTDLSPRVRQVVILSVGSLWQSPYELYAHRAAARHAGLPETCMAALVAGEPSADLSADEGIAQRLALTLTAKHAVDDDLYAEALRAFGEKGLVDLAVLSGCDDLVCSVLNLFAIPAPGDPLQENASHAQSSPG